MVDSRQKGARVESQVRDVLRKATSLNWERVPGSGALDPRHMLKGDLYVPAKENIYCVEVKGYAEDHLTSSILTSKNPQLLIWWEQCIRQAGQVGKKPLLIYKFDRSKIFVAFEDLPNESYNYMFIRSNTYRLFTSLLDDWLLNESPEFVK